jgi:oligopeptide/dipeptide ABC transporter ATP-binding protein
MPGGGRKQAMGDDLLISVNSLKTYFFTEQGIVHALDGVDFDIYRGRTLGVVGESGCGKSVTAQSILRIVPPPGKIVDGKILYYRRLSEDSLGEADEVIDITDLDGKGSQIRSIRGAEISMVFQEPMTSLSPVHTIGNQIMEAITLHKSQTSKAEARALAVDMLQRVGMTKSGLTIDRYPHQLSGGMRQRAVIAMALSCSPNLLIADEPTTALDVTTEAQILELMRELQSQFGMAIMYITHNLGVVAEMSEQVIVMYLGKVVESADVDSIFFDPQHPYTSALLKSVPHIGRKSRNRLEAVKGMVPDPFSLPQGCTFHPRCPQAIPGKCNREEPPLVEKNPGHKVKCHLYQ